MPEGLDPHTQEVMTENQKLNDQQRIAAERVGEAEVILAREEENKAYFQGEDLRGQGSPEVASAEQAVYVAEGRVDREKQRQEDHRQISAMTASGHLDVLIPKAKAEMDAELASRQEAEPTEEAK